METIHSKYFNDSDMFVTRPFIALLFKIDLATGLERDEMMWRFLDLHRSAVRKTPKVPR